MHALVSTRLAVQAIMRGRPRSEEGAFNTIRLAVQAIMRGRPKSEEGAFNTPLVSTRYRCSGHHEGQAQV